MKTICHHNDFDITKNIWDSQVHCKFKYLLYQKTRWEKASDISYEAQNTSHIRVGKEIRRIEDATDVFGKISMSNDWCEKYSIALILRKMKLL